jgi:hypothetical protein
MKRPRSSSPEISSLSGACCKEEEGAVRSEGEHERNGAEEERGMSEEDVDLVSQYLLRQVHLRVRMIPEDLDEEAEEQEWKKRWERWMSQADAEISRQGDGIDPREGEILTELGIFSDDGTEPVSRIVRIPGSCQNQGLDQKWWLCSGSPRVGFVCVLCFVLHARTSASAHFINDLIHPCLHAKRLAGLLVSGGALRLYARALQKHGNL